MSATLNAEMFAKYFGRSWDRFTCMAAAITQTGITGSIVQVVLRCSTSPTWPTQWRSTSWRTYSRSLGRRCPCPQGLPRPPTLLSLVPSYRPPPSPSKGPRKFYTRFGDGRSKYEKEQREAEELEAYLAALEAGRRYPSAVLEALRAMDMNEINLQLMVELVRHICRCMDPGAILIFLPGGRGSGGRGFSCPHLPTRWAGFQLATAYVQSYKFS